jgi:hypothetical protein
VNTFYKGVLKTDLKDSYIPGTVAKDFMTALQWQERIQSNKKRSGAARHLTHGESCIIEIQFDDILLSHEEFQRAGVEEHQRLSCWTSAVQDKAQLNTPCKFRILTNDEIDKLIWKR